MFDHVVLVFIFLNCITIALERPDIDPGSTVRPPSPGRRWVGGWGWVSRVQPAPLTAPFLQERVFLSVSNYIFTAIFVAEMTMKVATCPSGEPWGLSSGLTPPPAQQLPAAALLPPTPSAATPRA